MVEVLSCRWCLAGTFQVKYFWGVRTRVTMPLTTCPTVWHRWKRYTCLPGLVLLRDWSWGGQTDVRIRSFSIIIVNEPNICDGQQVGLTGMPVLLPSTTDDRSTSGVRATGSCSELSWEENNTVIVMVSATSWRTHGLVTKPYTEHPIVPQKISIVARFCDSTAVVVVGDVVT